MKPHAWSWVLPLFLLGSTLARAAEESAPINQLTAEEKAQGYVLLFDGKSLDNWVVMGKNKEGFKIVDGIIHSDSGSGAEWMRSKKEYDNFILRVDWKVSPGGNSGVFLRAPEKGNPWLTGYEVQISNEQPPRDPMHCTGALYGYVAVDPRPDETPNKWRTYEIRAEGKKITVFVDGTKACEGDMDTAEAIKNKPMKGFIGLQDSHGPKDTTIEYRNIRTKELKGQAEAVWTCPMHPQVKSDKPGKCPICGMNLVPMKKEQPAAK